MIYAIIAFIVGGSIGAILTSVIASGKIADLYGEIEYWKKHANYYLHIYQSLCNRFKEPIVRYYKSWHDEAS